MQLHSGLIDDPSHEYDACFTVAGAAHVSLMARVSRLTANMNMFAGTKTGVIVRPMQLRGNHENRIQHKQLKSLSATDMLLVR